LTLKGLVTSMAEKHDQVSSKKVFYSLLYTVSQFLPSLNQYRLYVRIGKHMCALLSWEYSGEFWQPFLAQHSTNVKIPLGCPHPPPPPPPPSLIGAL
jgi:hypothetical protein